MSKKICLAIGNAGAETWIIKKADKKKMNLTFTQPVLYREAILERVSTAMPDILVLAKDLKHGKDAPTLDAIVRKIRMSFPSCRIILLAGDLKPGDDFLKRMVSRGVLDIIVGERTHLDEVLDCIETPRDYAYAESLQGLEPDTSLDSSPAVAMVVPPAEEKKKGLFSSNPAPVQTAAPNPTEEDKGFKDVSNGTSVLTSPIPQINIVKPEIKKEEKVQPRGIIFEKFADIEKPKVSPVSQTNPHTAPQGTVQQPAPQQAPVQQTPASQSSHPVTDNSVLTSNSKMEIGNKPLSTGYMPKIILFVGARQGVGCTTTLINTAFCMAQSGKRVVVLDAVWNEKCIFDRLGMRHESTGLGNRGGALPKGFAGSYYRSFNDRAGNAIGGIQFLELVTGDVPEEVITTISKLSGYDAVLVDMSIAYFTSILNGLVSLADKIIGVTLQDGYEMMTLRNYLNVYQTKSPVFSKLSLIVNRANPKLSPSVSDTAKYIYINSGDIIYIPSDTNGFIKANAEKRNYMGKKKITGAYAFIASKI